MVKTQPDTKSVTIEAIGVWLGDDGHIHLASRDPDVEFVTTISNDPDSARYHPNAYGKLTSILRRYGKTVPGGETSPEA
jgi:hypothetical protein